ncbi:MAG: hypothetical protein COY58_02625 [Gammaproteobacteria bacterium CG_4_10_14_0_8_um_filter_38_16]|nr:MAG: hypothetical protein COY58_02625 [Gammaproteobacteria bacterium CG_4_10_14_0_8_um_filter_38_16]PJA03828.1 MAG: hypothetical protein COX72_02785 [Gammaproteobacteria bacterium CG_4_10_14_0_2_um_filter_38_22]PJB10802.1 MAG: hypothetical protein CO120_02890 [Gammaproteobacteria bacterium CG_4_9_14_3_um_filter_38_9]
MSSTDNKKNELSPEAFAIQKKEAEWKKTLQRLGLGEVDVTQVSADDVLYFAERWQFLQVVESGGLKQHLDTPELIEAKSGWTIVHHGDAMATSPGKWIFRGGYFQFTENENEEDDDGSGGIMNPKKGTFYKQAFDSATEIIQLAQQFGWAGVQIVDGHPNMQRAAWIEACRIGVRLDGYVPDVAAEKTRRRVVSQTLEEMHDALKGAPKQSG